MLLVAVVAWTVLEIWVAALVASQIGAGWTLLALLAISGIGLYAVRAQGRGVWREIREEAAAGRSPNKPLVSGLLLLVGGVLLLVPGFISGALGLLLLLPPVRTVVAAGLGALLWNRLSRAAAGGRFRVVSYGVGGAAAAGQAWNRRSRPDVIEGEGWEVSPSEGHELPPPG